MSIAVIYAKSLNNVIGKDNTLPWKLSKDLKYFKELTIGNIVVMGYNTYQSLPNGLLPKRFNIIVSKRAIPSMLDIEQPAYKEMLTNVENAKLPMVSFTPSLNYVLAMDKKLNKLNINKKIFFIGGSSIIKEGLAIADEAYVTEIIKHYEGNVYVDDIDLSVYKEVNRVPNIENDIEFDFVHYKRR